MPAPHPESQCGQAIQTEPDRARTGPGQSIGSERGPGFEAGPEVRTSIDELIERGDVAHHGEHREVLETFRMFAHDQGWLRRMRELMRSRRGAVLALRAAPVALRAPRQFGALLRTLFSSESWNWQFRLPDPPTRLLRHTWAAL